jgi:hypothetical protein
MQAIPYLDPTALPGPGKYSGARGPIRPATGVTAARKASGTVPDWITQSKATAQTKTPGAHGDISWITGHLSHLPLVSFHPRRTSLQILFGLGLAAIVAVGVCAKIDILSSPLTGISVCAVVFILATVTSLLFRNTDEWRAKHEKVLIFKKSKAESSKAARGVSRFERARRDVDAREHKATEAITKEAERAKATESKELENVDKRLTNELRSLERQKKRLQDGETAEVGRALRIYQQEHVEGYLRRASIGAARIPGIGQGVAKSLAAYGINSAADFSGLQFRTGPRGGKQVFLIRRNGLPVHPSGVGEKKAVDLDNWRRQQESAARVTQPSSLPVAQSQPIRSKYIQQRQLLADQDRAVRGQANSDKSQIKQKWATTHVAISEKFTLASQTFAQERAQADLYVSTAKKEESAAIMRQGLAEREVAAYRNVSYPRYLARVIRP